MDTHHLLDTNIVPELARKSPDPGVVAFIAEQPRRQVSAILFHELTYGLETANPDQKPRLTMFVAGLRKVCNPGRPRDRGNCGTLAGVRKAKGRILTVPASMMAASAVVRDLTLVTRYVKAFDTLGLKLINPFRG
ncbi:MAG: hypothetical protein NTZ14_03210 [Hyphomicrobiales bacterium]|nr:hypothetical protein [Hyphomicrobiales bacterium]